MSKLSIKETGKNAKISKNAMLDYLKDDPVYPPVRLMIVPMLSESRNEQVSIDVFVELIWRGQSIRYAVEIKTSSQPAVIEQAILQVQEKVRNSGFYPMVFAPYLSEDSLLRLSAADISGIDQSGNCVILGPSLAIWRSGAPNRFRESRSIQNPYSGDSSIITRCFLLKRQFRSLGELREFALNRIQIKGSESSKLLQIGTVSKVVSALESEIIVTRSSESIMIADARMLMNRLREQYRPGNSRRILGKTPFSNDEIWQRLSQTNSRQGSRSAVTGIASAAHYGILSGIERLSIYVDDVEAASILLDVTEGRAFANIELIEARNNLPFFDCRVEGNIVWASSIQTWLELVQGGPREREAAQNLEQQLLNNLIEEMK